MQDVAWPSCGHFGEDINLLSLGHPVGSLVTTLTTQYVHTIYPNSEGNVHVSITTCSKLLWNQFSTSTPLLHPQGTGKWGCLHLWTMTGQCILRGGEMLSRNARKATSIQESKKDQYKRGQTVRSFNIRRMTCHKQI
jgi:hypothetical protein